MAATEYPKRQKYFAHKFVRKMAKVCLANEIGPEACWMLTIIAHTEDAKHYKGPVTFSNGQLMPLVGLFSVPSLARAREKAVEAGWLHYEAGMKHRAGVYWVTLPERVQDIDDLPTDDSEDEFSDVTINASLNASGDEAQPKTEGKREASVQATVRQALGNRKASVHPSSLIPNPLPDPNIAEPVKPVPSIDGKKKSRKKKEPVSRPRCALFDTIAEMTSTDPKASGSFIAQVRNFLQEADPPYTPEDVRALPAALAANKLDVPFTLGVIRKYIGLTRKPKPPGDDANRREEAKTREMIEESLRRKAANERERLEAMTNDNDDLFEGIPDESF